MKSPLLKLLLSGITTSILFLSGCINPDSSEINQAYNVAPFPLEKALNLGSRWHYDVSWNGQHANDSSMVIGRENYNLPDGSSTWLYQYKEVDFSHDIFNDTAYVRLLNLEENALYEYGYEKRDKYNLDFRYGPPQLFSSKIMVADYFQVYNHLLHEDDNFEITSIGYTEIEFEGENRDCIEVKFREKSDAITSWTEYSVYYFDYGIIKMEGYLDGYYFKIALKNHDLPQ